MIDVHTIGAGGGSIAFVDQAGAFKVGPRSAGAVPGPAAYGHGGARPTVTDANVCWAGSTAAISWAAACRSTKWRRAA